MAFLFRDSTLASACFLAALLTIHVAAAGAAEPPDASSAQSMAIEPALLEAWVSECRREADQASPVSVDELTQIRQRAAAALQEFLASLRRGELAASGWESFLQLTTLQTLLDDRELEIAQLDVLAARWHNAPGAWQQPALQRAAIEIQKLIAANRRKNATAVADIRDDWLRTAELLAALPTATAVELTELEGVLGRLVSANPNSETLAEIQTRLSGPNIVVHVPISWLERKLNDSVYEPYQINGVYAGARTSGSGVLQGSMTGRVVPSVDDAQMVLRFAGVSTSRSVGSSSGVRVRSRATTNFDAEKRFTITPTGLAAHPATATATARVQYENVSAGGGPIRRQRSIDAAYGRRGQAQRDTESDVRQTVIRRLDEEGLQWAQELNRELAKLRNDAIVLPKALLVVELRASRDALRWQARLTRVGQMPITPPPPVPSSGEAITVQIAASAIEQRSNAVLENGEFSPELLQRALGASSKTKAPTPEQEFSGVLPPEPFQISFVDDGVTAELCLDQFESAGTRYPPMSVLLNYKIGLGDRALFFERAARPRATMLSTTDGAPRSTGRATTLRVGVERRLDRAIDRQFSWSGVDVNLGASQAKLVPAAVQTSGQWLEVAYSDALPSTRTAPTSR